MNSFAQFLLEQRVLRKLNYIQMAALLDVSDVTVNNWENCRNKPPELIKEAVIDRLTNQPKRFKDNPMAFGQFLKSERMRLGLSKAKMSKAVGFYNKWHVIENGKIPSPLMMEGIAARISKI